VIISEPSNPWIPGAANLFTLESFTASSRRLAPDGLFCQWLQLYELQPEDFATVLRTFSSVFPHIHLFRVDQDAVLLGSLRPQPISETELRRRLTGRVKQDLQRIDIHGVEDLLARYWIGGDELLRCVPNVALNTDDNRLIEFAAPLQVLAGGDRKTGAASIAQMFEGRTKVAIPHVHLDVGTRPEEFWANVSEASLRMKGLESLIYARHSLGLRLNPKAAAVQADAWISMNRSDDARTLLTEAARQFPDSPEVFRVLTRLEIRSQHWTQARAHAERWVALQPTAALARFNVGRCQFHLGQDAEALAALESIEPTLMRQEEFRDLPFYLGVLQSRAGQYPSAIHNLQAFLRRMPQHGEARSLLAATLQRAGRGPEAAVQWQKITVMNIRQSEKLRREALELWEKGQQKESIARLAEAVKLDPSNGDLVIELSRAWTMVGDRDAATRTLREYLAWNPDRAPAVGYLSQLLSELQQDNEARLLAARYRALTGTGTATTTAGR
jgi:predicted Zn-dependent protease